MNHIDSPLLKMEGRSGCKLEVQNRQGVFFVKKISRERSYNERLLKQAAKQNDFFRRNPSLVFKAPQVLSQSQSQEPLTWFEMPYLHGQKYSEFFERNSVQEIRLLASRYIDYFQQSLNASSIENVDGEVIHEKIRTLRHQLEFRAGVDQDLLIRTIDYLNHIPSRTIPMRACHGDFTFSNMLFCEDGIYLVDFLDSFIESPLIDLVKFRQDSFFYWSLLIENFPESRVGKIIQIFNFLDSQVFGALKKNESVQTWYTYLQVFNLLRILPYVSHKEEIEFVQRSIQSIIPTA
jgi:hypothetical protein